MKIRTNEALLMNGRRGKRIASQEASTNGLNQLVKVDIIAEINKEKEYFRKRLKSIVSSLYESGAEDIVALDVSAECDYAFFLVICSGRSEKHVEGVVRRALKDLDGRLPVRGIEGLKQSTWVLVDFYGIILHVFTRQAREFYKLEDAWFTAKQIRIHLPKTESFKGIGT